MGPIGCPETSIRITNVRFVTMQKSEGLNPNLLRTGIFRLVILFSWTLTGA